MRRKAAAVAKLKRRIAALTRGKVAPWEYEYFNWPKSSA